MRGFPHRLLYQACLLVLLASLVHVYGGVITLTSSEKAALLSEHNRVRSQVFPAAASMPNVTWDETLASIWQKHPQNCVFSHTSNTYRTSVASGYSWIGENLAASYDKRIPAAYVSMWESEKTYWTYNTIDLGCQVGQVCGHYTQVVWASSVKIGCAFIDCTASSSSLASRYILACNYGPGGNYAGQYPYQKASSTCTPKTCDSQGYECGTVSNGCGGSSQCTGSCSATETCGSDHMCHSCLTQTCEGEGYTCGTIFNGCSGEVCGDHNGGCPAGQSCIENVCTTPTTCIPKSCADMGVSCGVIDNGCDATIQCGTCDAAAGSVCEYGKCVNTDPCRGECKADAHEYCDTSSHSCKCLDGYVDDGFGTCEPVSSIPMHWTQIEPKLDSSQTMTDWILTTDYSDENPQGVDALQMVAFEHNVSRKLSWDRANIYSSTELTAVTTFVKTHTSQNIGIALRYGQIGSSRANDGSLWQIMVDEVTDTASVKWVITYNGKDYPQANAASQISWQQSMWNKLRFEIRQVNGYLQHRLWINDKYVFGSYYYALASTYLPSIGGMYVYTTSTAEFRQIMMNTATTLHVTVTECMTDYEWAQLVSKVLRIPIESVIMRDASDDQALCSDTLPVDERKRQMDGVQLGSAFTFTLLSTDEMSSTAMASQFNTWAKSGIDGRLEGTRVQSIEYAEPTTVDDTAGDTPANPEGLPDPTPDAGGAGSPATLSAAEIAGIVVGAVVGVALLVGAASAVAVVAGALILRKRAQSRARAANQQQLTSPDLTAKPKENECDSSIQPTDIEMAHLESPVVSPFGSPAPSPVPVTRSVPTGAGPNVFDHNPKNHRSITSRLHSYSHVVRHGRNSVAKPQNAEVNEQEATATSTPGSPPPSSQV